MKREEKTAKFNDVSEALWYAFHRWGSNHVSIVKMPNKEYLVSPTTIVAVQLPDCKMVYQGQASKIDGFFNIQ
jgi:hypothetical protein